MTMQKFLALLLVLLALMVAGCAPASGSAKTYKGKVQRGYEITFTAAFHPDGTAAGTLIQKGTMAGTTCTTYELKWDAQKQ